MQNTKKTNLKQVVYSSAVVLVLGALVSSPVWFH